jgi:hypothetical protein
MPSRWASALSARLASALKAACGASPKPVWPVPEPSPAVPRLMAGLSRSASAGPSGCSSGLEALDFGVRDFDAPAAFDAAGLSADDLGAFGMAAIWDGAVTNGRRLLPGC